MTKPTISVEEAKRRKAERDAKVRAEREQGRRKARSRFIVIPLADIDFNPSDAGWLVEGLLPDTGLGVLYGRWKSFKSFVALDLAWAVTCKPAWAGRPIKRRGAVVYVAAEGQGHAGIRKRIAAYKLSNDNDELPPLYLIEARPNLGWAGSGDVAELVAAIRAALPADLEVVLIIIDTLSRTLAGKDENGEGMRNFLDNAEDLGAKLSCLVMAVHHEGAAENDRPRGGTVLPAGVVATWRVKRRRGELACTLLIEEAKDSVSDLAFNVTLRKFEFGDEHDERREDTLMVDEIAASAVAGVGEKIERQPKITPTLRAFMDAEGQAVHDHGKPFVPFSDGPTVRAVTIDKVREVYFKVRGDEVSDESKRKVFRDQLAQAVKRGMVIVREINGERWLWLPSKH